MKSIANGADPMVASNWVPAPRPDLLPQRRDRRLGTGPPLVLQVTRRHRGLDRVPRQEHQHLHVLLPHHPRAEDHLERRRHPEPRPSAGRRRHPDAALRRPRLGELLDQRHRARTVEYAGDWSSGSGCGNQCFWGNDHWSSVRMPPRPSASTAPGSPCSASRHRQRHRRHLHRRRPRTTHRLLQLDPRRRTTHLHQPGSPRRPHTLKVRVTGDKNPASTNTVISLDRIEVY